MGLFGPSFAKFTFWAKEFFMIVSKIQVVWFLNIAEN